MARERASLEASAAKMLEDADDLKTKIIQELNRRKTRVVECDGVRIVKSQGTQTNYDWDSLKPLLKPSQRKLCEKMRFDPRGLAAAVLEGLIDISLVSEHTETKKNAPYITVTETPR
jgi:hypothetical protein